MIHVLQLEPLEEFLLCIRLCICKLKGEGIESGVASVCFSPIVYALELHEIHTKK